MTDGPYLYNILVSFLNTLYERFKKSIPATQGDSAELGIETIPGPLIVTVYW